MDDTYSSNSIILKRVIGIYILIDKHFIKIFSIVNDRASKKF